MSKRTFEEAFDHQPLKDVKIGDFCVEITMFKVEPSPYTHEFNILTTENNKFIYGREIIVKLSKSATLFNSEELVTKTELIELFARISVSDVWSAEYQTFDKTKGWSKELASKIQNLPVNEAADYIKKNFGAFGKTNRKIVGHKIYATSDNNYYQVRDLQIHFDLLKEGKDVQAARKQSIRNLDVNSLQFLIFNGVKYVLRSK